MPGPPPLCSHPPPLVTTGHSSGVRAPQCLVGGGVQGSDVKIFLVTVAPEHWEDQRNGHRTRKV